MAVMGRKIMDILSLNANKKLKKFFWVISILFFLFNINTLITSPGAIFYKNEGDKKYIQKEVLSAIHLYKKSLQVNPNYLPSLIALGSVLRETQAYTEALFYLQKGYKLNKNDIRLYYELASTYFALKNYSAARNIAYTGVKLSPYDPALNYLLAKIYLLEDRTYLAEKKLKKIIQANPSHFESYIALGEIYLHEKKVESARKAFQKAKRIKPEDPGVFYLLAEIELKKMLLFSKDDFFNSNIDIGKFRDVIDLLENAIGFDSLYVPANALLGTIYTLTRNCKESSEYFKAVLHINPEHHRALYYSGLCDKEKSLTIYPKLLNKDFNNEIIRFQYEWNLIKKYTSNKHPEILRQSRYHYQYGKKLIHSNRLNQGIYEIRWSTFLFPDYIEPHYDLFSYYRSIQDIYFMKNELIYLKDRSEDIKYKDLYEKYIIYRRQLLSWKSGIEDPIKLKTKAPLFVFNFSPQNPFGDYPDAGKALARKINFSFAQNSHIYILPYHEAEKLYEKIESSSSFGTGGTFHPNTVRTYIKPYQINSSYPEYNINQFHYALYGEYSEINEGLDVNATLIDIYTGIEKRKFHFRSSGKGYLRKISLFLKKNIEDYIPPQGKIIRINPTTGVLVNMGKRDGLKKGDIFYVYRNRKKFAALKITKIANDICWAYPINQNDIFRLKKYDHLFIN